MPCSVREALNRPRAERRPWRGALAAACLLLAAAAARAEAIEVNSAELVQAGNGYVLNADFAISLNPVVITALSKGVPVHFVVDVEVSRPRKYWFGKRIASGEHSVRLSYVPLTRQYEVSDDQGTHVADSLEAALRWAGRVRGWRVLDGGALERGVVYRAAVRMRLDPARLPPPFQVSSLTTRDWAIESDWYQWRFMP